MSEWQEDDLQNISVTDVYISYSTEEKILSLANPQDKFNLKIIIFLKIKEVPKMKENIIRISIVGNTA